VVAIPAGATNIDIRQHGHSNRKDDDNYLGELVSCEPFTPRSALQNDARQWLLNGAWQVSVFALTVDVRGTVLEYSGSDHVVETITSGSVPTKASSLHGQVHAPQETLHVHVLSVGDIAPPNITYSFIVPTQAGRVAHRQNEWERTRVRLYSRDMVIARRTPRTIGGRPPRGRRAIAPARAARRGATSASTWRARRRPTTTDAAWRTGRRPSIGCATRTATSAGRRCR